MFHVEHPAKFLYIFCICVFLLVSCENHDPHPEKSDRIYNSLVEEAAKIDKDIAAQETQIESIRKEIISNDGNNQYNLSKHNKQRLFNTANTLEKLKQKKLYYLQKSEERTVTIQKQYKEAIIKNKPWPPENASDEYSDYKNELKMQNNNNLEWSSKNRIEEYKYKKNK